MLGAPYKLAHKEAVKNLAKSIQEHDGKISPPSNSGEVNVLGEYSSTTNVSPSIQGIRGNGFNDNGSDGSDLDEEDNYSYGYGYGYGYGYVPRRHSYGGY